MTCRGKRPLLHLNGVHPKVRAPHPDGCARSFAAYHQINIKLKALGEPGDTAGNRLHAAIGKAHEERCRALLKNVQTMQVFEKSGVTM